jgi:hypothetical protein
LRLISLPVSHRKDSEISRPSESPASTSFGRRVDSPSTHPTDAVLFNSRAPLPQYVVQLSLQPSRLDLLRLTEFKLSGTLFSYVSFVFIPNDSNLPALQSLTLHDGVQCDSSPEPDSVIFLCFDSTGKHLFPTAANVIQQRVRRPPMSIYLGVRWQLGRVSLS